MSGAASRFELQPTLSGEHLLLRPLVPGDFEALYAVAADPQIWEQHPDPNRYQRARFEKFFAEALECRGAFVVIERSSGRIIGSSRYYDLDLKQSEVVLGYTFFAREFWGGPYNRELKQLMVEHAFRFVEKAQFHVSEQNVRSQRALEKIGAAFVGTGSKMRSDGSLHHFRVYEFRRADQ